MTAKHDPLQSRPVPVTSPLAIRIDRDSVCAGDDTEPHDRIVAADPTVRLSTLIDDLQRHYLPSIAGGEATWTIESSAVPARPIGVCAQQWSAPGLRVRDEAVGRHFANRDASLFFRYRCQVSPDATLASLGADDERPA